MKKRKLKPLPRMIFDGVRITLFTILALFLAVYLFSIGIYVNACQMDAKYDYLETENFNG